MDYARSYFEYIRQDVEAYLSYLKTTMPNYPFRPESDADVFSICRYLDNIYGTTYDTYDIFNVCKLFIGKETR